MYLFFNNPFEEFITSNKVQVKSIPFNFYDILIPDILKKFSQLQNTLNKLSLVRKKLSMYICNKIFEKIFLEVLPLRCFI